MLRTLATIVICWKAAEAGFYPPDCPVHCECNGPATMCEGTFIPELDQRITRYTIKNVTPSMKTLTTNITYKLDHLVSLNLISVGLEDFEKGALGIISNLETLKITQNSIRTLSAEDFEGCNMLAFLNLENNNIQTIENDTFQLLTSLKNLSLAHNAITAMPPMLPKGIQSLNFKNNQIEDIHNIFFEELITLNLCDNGILKIDPKEMKLNGLKELCLGGSDFIVDPTLINDMKFPVLESLELEGRDEAALYISGMAQRNILRMISKSLQYLSMESCILQNLDLFNLQASKLQGLKASNVWLPMPDSPRGRNVKFSLGSVEVFDLSGSSGLAKLFIQTPAQISLPTLQILRLSRCHITSFPESVLRSKTPNITHLDISHNPLHCTCFGLSWIQKYVQGGQIQLMEEENTTCSTPDHLNGIPLLMATLCPLTEAMTMTTTAMTTAMRGNVTSQRDITTIPTTEVINSTPGTSKSSTTMETIDTTIKTDIPTTPKTNISTTIVTTTKNTQTTLDVPSYSTTSPMSPENETELPLTVTLRTSFTISTTENISDVRNLQRSGSGISASNTEPTPGISASDKEPTPGIRANNTEPTPGIGVSNTEPAPALTIDQVNLFHVVSAVLAVLLATLLTTAGIVYCRKKCNKRRRREGNMVSMGQLTDSYEPLI